MITDNENENESPISIKNAEIGKKKIESIAMMPQANPMSRAPLRSPPAEPGNKISDIQHAPARYSGHSVGLTLREDGGLSGELTGKAP
jgi:hypothetical protein